MSSNITSLYVATARLIFQAHISNPASWAYEVANLFPSLRETLKCCVCQSLLVDPYSPKQLCPHNVCKICLGKKKILSTPCMLCDGDKEHVENEELSLLLVCYNKLCSYIRQSETLLKYLSECGGDNDLLNILVEGEYYLSPPTPQQETAQSYPDPSYPIAIPGPSCSSIPGPALAPTPSTSSHHKHRRTYTSHCNGNSSLLDSHPQPIYSVLVANEGNKITIKRKVPVPEEYISVVNQRVKKPPKAPSSRGTGSGSGCRCGLATAAPGKLTCCGQRCLCYTERRPCHGCKCRGCRNPHTAHGKKKLRGLEEFQMSLHQNSQEPEHEDTTIKIVGINSSNNNFQVIRIVDQEPS